MTVLPWQASQWLALTERIQRERIPHAMLFHGPQGIGKAEFVTALVARLFCTSPQNNFACGVCDGCHLLQVKNHPDVRYIELMEDKKNIGVDQIREIIEYLSLTPHSARYKIAVIDQAELMTVSAANSLLKTLEEPPKTSLIFLITHRPEQLLPTILSRCQKTLFKLPDAIEADRWLSQQIADTKRRSALLALANGAPLKALDYDQQSVLEQRQTQFESLLALVNGKTDPVSAAETWLKLDFELSLYSLVSWVIDLARLKSSRNPPRIINTDLQQKLMSLNQGISLQEILHYHEFLNDCLVWSKSNANPQLLLEDILIRWTTLFRLKE